jgi:hypothetical protein
MLISLSLHNEEMEAFAEHSQAALVIENGRTALRSIPNLRDAEPLLPVQNVVTRQDGSLSRRIVIHVLSETQCKPS